MNDLLAAFGINEDDLQEGKKNLSKNKKKENTKDVLAKKENGNRYELPIKFCAGHLQQIFTDEKEKSWSEDKLKSEIRKNFRELAGLYFKLQVMNIEEKEEGVSTYIRPEILYKGFDNEEKLEFPLEVVVGESALWLDTKITLDEIRTLWSQEHPEYKGCKFQYDEKQKLLIPFMEGDAPGGKQYSCPITVGYLNLKETYTEDDFDEEVLMEDDIRDKFCVKYPEFEGCDFVYQEELNLLFPVMSKEKEKSNKLIALPIEVRAGGINILVQPEDLDGKNVATLEEIRMVLEKIYPEYSKERTEMIYDKKHFVIPILKSSRKGVVIIPSDSNWQHEVRRDHNGCEWRIEKRPFGIFRYNMTENGSVLFERTAPKVPKSLLCKVIKLFKEEATCERAVQIFYDLKSKKYELLLPKQKVTASSVEFERDVKKERELELMMDIHSHASFPAFFSVTDNRDEVGIRLYMVIGNLDRPKHTFVFRAGLAGHFGVVTIEDIFE